MLIGDKALFAVEYDLDEAYEREWLLGRFCYWVRGTRVGHFASGTSLRSVLFQLRRVVLDNGKREHPELAALPGAELFHRLNAALYGPDPSPDEQRALEEMWARFYAHPQEVDVFDGWRVFLVDRETTARVLFRRLQDGEPLHEVELPRGVFDRVVRETYEQLDRRYEHERNAPGSE